jgi:hypothetical protein
MASRFVPPSANEEITPKSFGILLFGIISRSGLTKDLFCTIVNAHDMIIKIPLKYKKSLIDFSLNCFRFALLDTFIKTARLTSQQLQVCLITL